MVRSIMSGRWVWWKSNDTAADVRVNSQKHEEKRINQSACGKKRQEDSQTQRLHGAGRVGCWKNYNKHENRGGGDGEGLNVNILFFLSKLPTAKETAHLIIQRVFFIHGLSIDIILDQAFSVTSFLKAFCWRICSSPREKLNQKSLWPEILFVFWGEQYQDPLSCVVPILVYLSHCITTTTQKC